MVFVNKKSYNPSDVLNKVLDDSNELFRVSDSALQGLITFAYNGGSVDYPDSVTDVYTFRQGTTNGLDGTVVGTITVIYTDSSKNDILRFYKT